MSILVTGKAGYICSHTIVDLLKIDIEIQVIDNFSHSSEKVFENIKKKYFMKTLILDFKNLSAFFINQSQAL